MEEYILDSREELVAKILAERISLQTLNNLFDASTLTQWEAILNKSIELSEQNKGE